MKYKDERLKKEQTEIKAKLFDYIFIVFFLIFIINTGFVNNYTKTQRMFDYFIIYTTILYALYLEYKSKVDFYSPSKSNRKGLAIVMIGVGAFATIPGVITNHFTMSSPMAIVYIITFISAAVSGGLVYVIVSYTVKKYKMYRHARFEAKLDAEEQNLK